MEHESSMPGSKVETGNDWLKNLNLAEQEDTMAYCDWLHDQFELNEWKQAQHARAPEILATLRRYLPEDEYSAVVRFLDNPFCRDCIGAFLQPQPEVVNAAEEAELFCARERSDSLPF